MEQPDQPGGTKPSSLALFLILVVIMALVLLIEWLFGFLR